MSTAEESSTDMLAQLRVLSHRLSNSLEVIMQAQYLLQRAPESSQQLPRNELARNGLSKKELPQQELPNHAVPKEKSLEDQKWTTMIGNAAAEAAETNREIRDAVRRLSALHAAEANPLRLVPRNGQKNRGASR